MTQSDVTHFSSPDPAKHARSVAQPSLQHSKGGCPRPQAQHSIWRSEAAELRELLVQRAGAYRPRVYEVVAGRVLHDAHVAVQVDLVRVKVRVRVRARVRVRVS